MKTRYFALNDGAVRNGSFTALRLASPVDYLAHFMNGDYMGRQELAPVPLNDSRKARVLVAVDTLTKVDGLKEYLEKDFLKLAPRCVGGKGNSYFTI